MVAAWSHMLQHAGSSGDRTSADEPRSLSTLSPSATCERRGATSPRAPLQIVHSEEPRSAMDCTASFASARGRARVRFSRSAGREDPTGRLLCEFEVGLSLKNSRAATRTKTRSFRKKLPVRLYFTVPALALPRRASARCKIKREGAAGQHAPIDRNEGVGRGK